MVHTLSPKVQPTARARTDAPSDHSRSLEALRFIQALAAEARALKADVAASPAHRTIDDQSTSESMSSAEFRLASKSAKFSSKVLGKAFDFARKGQARADDPRLSAGDRAELARLQRALGRGLMRAKDSALTMGERHQASVELADTVLELERFALAKAADAVIDEGKKALGGALDRWLGR